MVKKCQMTSLMTNRLSEDDLSWQEENGEKAVEERLGLTKNKSNIGKSLRKIADNNYGKIIKKAKLFDESAQLKTGPRQKITLNDLEEGDFNPDDADDGFDDNIDDGDADDEEPALLKTSMRADPFHVRNQRKLEGDILGIRIRLQPIMTALLKLPSDKQALVDSKALRGVISLLFDVRREKFTYGHPDLSKEEDSIPKPTDDLDEMWRILEKAEDALWKRHRKVISAWERRAHLSSSGGKELRVMNKSAIDQTQAALARRAEISSMSSFEKEDHEFYQNLLKDFVHARSAESSVVNLKAMSKRKQYLNEKRNKEAKVNYEVREKMVNFSTPISFPAPPMDLDQLVKSLFRT